MGFPDTWIGICLYGYIPHIPGVAISTGVNSDIQFRGQLGSGTLEANVNIRSSVGFSLCCRPIEINECCHSAASGCPISNTGSLAVSPRYIITERRSLLPFSGRNFRYPVHVASTSSQISGSGNKFYILHSMAENVQEILCYKG
ncbi:MAG: hypothetical protein AMDU5_GPLC00017G0084 [Thermoplasmatales archaeon Gpl]|nr:MAG: hypothetical protein AMDU5_GPLC00017G0084 [Thermoplasmatales archaeon Gpl]